MKDKRYWHSRCLPTLLYYTDASKSIPTTLYSAGATRGYISATLRHLAPSVPLFFKVATATDNRDIFPLRK